MYESKLQSRNELGATVRESMNLYDEGKESRNAVAEAGKQISKNGIISCRCFKKQLNGII